MKKLTQIYIKTFTMQFSCKLSVTLEWKDINKSNERQTYTYGIGVLRKKCSPKWENFTLKQGENVKKHAHFV
jgi:hypothetical protein